MNDTIYKNDYMNSLFNYIENNLIDSLDTELLTSVGYVSCAQLYRNFYNLTGHSVKEYVRKRRLSNALALIKTSDMTLTDIAHQCGYSSHQAICRTVKHTLGITPSEYKNSDTYYFFPPWNGKPLQSVVVSSQTGSHALRVLFYHSSLTNIENIAVDTFLQVFPDYDGRIFGRNGEQRGGKLCYELYLTETDRDYSKLSLYNFKLTNETICFAALFATAVVRNDEQTINTAWNYLYSEWLQNSMFEYTGELYYEEYIIKNKKPVKLKLYLPIRKRNEDTRITLICNPDLHFIVSKSKGYNSEKTASQAVVKWVSVNHPHIIRTAKEFYLRRELNSCVCGIRIKSRIKILGDGNIENIVTEKSDYLVLESNVTGDYGRYIDMLMNFAKDNGMTADKTGIFAVYDVKEDFDNPKIKMYCPIKIDKK